MQDNLKKKDQGIEKDKVGRNMKKHMLQKEKVLEQEIKKRDSFILNYP